jgi:hypothetical protein
MRDIIESVDTGCPTIELTKGSEHAVLVHNLGAQLAP